MGDKKITKRQHFVPQVYLRGFSADAKRVWSYSLDPLDSGTLAPIESLCRENYLYEIRGEDGNLIFPNWIETVLCGLEGMFATNLRALERKACHKENYTIKCFLTSQEKAFWKVFVGVQMMRSPSVIRAVDDVAKEFLDNQLSDNQIRTFAVSQCLPFFSELRPEDKTAFSLFLRPLLNMSIAIGVDESGTMFTSDEPIYCYSSHRENLAEIEEYDKIIMPLTSELVLFLRGGEAAKGYDRNRLFPLRGEDQEAAKLSIAYSARTRVFAKRELSESDRKLIERARREKAEDLAVQRG